MTILLIHGPNLNLLGKRNKLHYGMLTLQHIESLVRKHAKVNGYDVLAVQSNHEGVLIDWIQENAPTACGIIINPGALTHYSYAVHDALLDTELPCVEVHLSDIHSREEWRKRSVTAPACIAQIIGKKEQGYIEAVKLIMDSLHHDRSLCSALRNCHPRVDGDPAHKQETLDSSGFPPTRE